MTTSRLEIKSGIFEIRPKKLLFLNAGGALSLTPKKTYHAFLTDNINYPIVIVKDGYRYFPVVIAYAKNNFDYKSENPIANQEMWLQNFQKMNQHIRKENEKLILVVPQSRVNLENDTRNS